MATATAYNPNLDLNARLAEVGLSKTVYALVTPQTEEAVAASLGDRGSRERRDYLNEHRAAWTGKQDSYHRAFFDEWLNWASPVIDMASAEFPFQYPTAGASDPIKHLIYDLAARAGRAERLGWPEAVIAPAVHVFEGEYEGYKHFAEASGLTCIQHSRDSFAEVAQRMKPFDLFFISQPSAIDGNVWPHFNNWLEMMPDNSVVADVTYVGAIPQILEPIRLRSKALRNVVFSLSKPFGVYYHRIGGVFCREEDEGLFGYLWFKNLPGIRLGRTLMKRHHVFDLPRQHAKLQSEMRHKASMALGISLDASDVYLLAHAPADRYFDSNDPNNAMMDYLGRGGVIRVCLSHGMAKMLGTDVDL